MVPSGKKSILSDNEIMTYLALAVKHLRLMALLVCFALMLGLVYYTYARPVYYSKALLRYTVFSKPLDTEKLFRDADLQSTIAQLSSGPVMRRTAQKLGVNATTQEEGYKECLRKIVVRPDSDSTIVVQIWPYSLEMARDWTETMVQEFLLNREERRLTRMKNSIETLATEMEGVRKKMEEVFDSRSDYRRTNHMLQLAINLEQYKGIPDEMYVIKQQLALMDQVRESLQNRDTVAKLSLFAAFGRDLEGIEAKGRRPIPEVSIGQFIFGDHSVSTDQYTPSVLVVPSMISSPRKDTWEELDMERRQLERQAHETGRIYLPGHPKMAAIRKQLVAANKALELEAEAEMNRFNLEYTNRLDRLHDLEAKLPEYQESTRHFQKQVQEFTLFNAGQLAWQNMYEQMSRRLNALDFGAEREHDQVQYVGLLELRETPVSPNRLKLILYSLLIGLALAIAVPFLLEYVDSRVSDVEQVEETLHIRGLGVVPRVTEVPLDSLLLTEAHTSTKLEHHITENFRLIRTNLVMNSATPALPQVILVTSAMPQEGKTVVAANLAASFAKKGETTLLIDADLRRGRLHRLFNCPSKPGLSEILAGEGLLENGLRPVGNGNGNGHLTLLVCGKHVHGASELLDSAAFPRLMDDLRHRYQRIILDTPPVLGLSETAIIQRQVDGVLLVIWSDYTPMRSVKTAIQTLQTNGAKLSGFVLNRLDFSALANRYRYFYYSPYYYSRYRPVDSLAVSAESR